MPLALTLSNRFEALLDALLARLSAEHPEPLTPQWVIVPSAAVRRHIELEIARRQGVCANLEFRYLGQWLWQTVARHIAAPDRAPLDPARLAWAVYHQLDQPALRNAHPALTAYLAEADPAMHYELARRIAQVFDDTLTYRPEWMEAWRLKRPAPLGNDAEARACERWQADLWRRVTAALGVHGQHPFLHFLQDRVYERATPAPPGDPAVHVFALPTLPPLHLEMLRKLSHLQTVEMYALNPCAAYWFEIVDRKRLSWLAARGRDALHETGNRLLAAWGRQTQAHIDLLFSDDGEIVEEAAIFAENETDTLLARLQNAILALEELPTSDTLPAPKDRSLEVHVCHGLNREIEVLHDQLLACLDGPEPFMPWEILVVTPDLAAAAPLIEGVFGNAPPVCRIPFTLTGCPQTRDNPVAKTLTQALALLPGRFPASAVFDLLQAPPVMQRLGLDAESLAAIRDWIAASGIRWGLDAPHRAHLDLPAIETHSFADGIDRLFLAYALGEAGEDAEGRPGAGNPEGQTALALGRFWRFVQTLAHFQSIWREPCRADDWRDRLDALVDALIPANFAWAEARRELAVALGEWHQALAVVPDPLPFEAVASALLAQLAEPARGGQPGGSVTFASLASLRNLPYRMICIIGLNDGVFPGAERPAEFDLMAQRPQRGDRQRRIDERNLFLDLLLAARERFYLSYTGRSIRDNSPLPPSLLVTELLDVVCEAYPATLRTRLVVEHPLQAFSPDNFDPAGDVRRQSYRAEFCAALQHAMPPSTAIPDEEDADAATTPSPAFFSAPLPPPDAAQRTVDLDRLLRFFRNPCQALLRERLGIQLAGAEAELDDDEPFVPDFLARQQLAQRLLPWVLADTDADALHQRARAGVEYPPGPLGAVRLADELVWLKRFGLALRPTLAQPPLPPHPFALHFALGDDVWHLQGSLSDLRPAGQVGYRYDEARPTDYQEAWLTHLVLCAANPPAVEAVTDWHARDRRLHFGPLAPQTAHEMLAHWMHALREGLIAPLPFFPKSSWAFVKDGGLAKARSVWTSSRFHPFGEDRHAAYRLALRGHPDPLDSAFEHWATTLLGPMLTHCEEIAP